MLFLANVVDYPVEERQPRVHHRFTIPYLRLFDSQGLPLGAVQKFDTTTMLGTRKDGSTVQVQRYGWVCPDQSSFAMLRRCLPPDQHHLISLETSFTKEET
jgi:hypothetical protein